MAYCVDPRGAAGAPGEVHTTKMNDVGAIRQFSDGFYIYLAGASSMAAMDWVTYLPGTFTAIRMTTAGRGPVAVATAAVDASTKWGWFGIEGAFSTLCLSATGSNLPLYASGTAGALTSTLTKNLQIKGAHNTSAAVSSTGGGTHTTVINRPYIGSYDESA